MTRLVSAAWFATALGVTLAMASGAWAAQPVPSAPPASEDGDGDDAGGDDGDGQDGGADEGGEGPAGPNAGDVVPSGPGGPDGPAPAPPPAPAPGSPELSGVDAIAHEAGQFLDRGQLGSAESRVAAALERDGRHAGALFQQARIRYYKGETVPALQAINMALASDPAHGGALLLLVRVQANQGTADQSVSRLAKLANTHRDDIGVQLAYGEVQLLTDKHPGALAAATRALKLSETSTAAMKLMARTYLSLGRPGAAEYVLEEARKRTPVTDPEVLTLLASLRYDEDEPVRARLLLEQAVEAAPGYVEALNSLGAVYNDIRDFDAASDTLQRVVSLTPQFARAWLNLGTAQRGLSDFIEAERSWRRALAIDDGLGAAWFNLGVLYLENPIEGRDRIEQLTDAVNAFNAYKRLRPANEPVDPVAEQYISDARTLIEQERERRKQELKAPPDADEGLEGDDEDAFDDGFDDGVEDPSG